jgi:hypothetical protein
MLSAGTLLLGTLLLQGLKLMPVWKIQTPFEDTFRVQYANSRLASSETSQLQFVRACNVYVI